MHLHRAQAPIDSVEAWFEAAPPKSGKAHWKDGRSAKELARSWFPSGSAGPVVPDEFRALLASHPELEGITLLEGQPELRIAIDDLPGEPCNADLALLADAAGRRVAITVEALADETFGDRVEAVLRGAASDLARDRPTNRVERVRTLAAALLPAWKEGDPHLGELRYQLLTGVAGSLAHARSTGAGCALFVVHELVDLARTKESRRRNNREDLDRFVRRLTGGAVERLQRGVLAGPVRVPGNAHIPGTMDLYLGKVRRDLG